MIATAAQAADAVQVARGEYLVTIGICASCHTPRDANGEHDWGLRLAGGRGGALTAPNLTPDPETGLGNWTDDQIVDAIRNGKRPDGSRVRPPMGVFFYRHLSDDDVRSIAAYLHSLPPIKNKTVRSASSGPAPTFDAVTTVPAPDREDRIGYGRYLVGTVAHCLQCHSPRVDGLPDLARAGAGGNAYAAPGGGTVIAPNLTPANPYGIAKWTDDEIKIAVTQGVRPNGSRLVPVMDFHMYAAMTPDDLSNVVAFLRSLKPIASDAQPR
jgi:mono/diheme cytochrome c family protein